MLRSLIALPLLLAAGAVPAAVDAQAVHARLVALDAQFARALKAKDLSLYSQTRADAQALIGTLGNSPVEPCRAAAIHLESSRVGEWVDRHRPALSDADRRIAQANREDFKAWLQKCQQSAR